MGFTKDDLQDFKKKVIEKSNSSNFYRIKDGKQVIRLFHSPNEVEFQPFFVLCSHWYSDEEGNRKFILCTERTEVNGETSPCPICKLVKKLFKNKDKAIVDLARDLAASTQYVQWAFIQHPDKEAFNTSPELLSISTRVMNQILEEIQLDAEEQAEEGASLVYNTWDLDKGIPITIKRTKGATKFDPTYNYHIGKKVMDLTKEPYAEQVAITPSVYSKVSIPTEEEQLAAVEAINAFVERSLQNLGIDNPEEGTKPLETSEIDKDTLEKAESVGSMLNTDADEEEEE